MRKVLFYATLMILVAAGLLSAAEISRSKKNDIQNNYARKSTSNIVEKETKNKSVIPQTMAYQGVLKENGIVLSGDFDLSFKIYSVSTGGTALWNETHSAVAIFGGIFNVVLGSVTPIPLNFTEQYYIGVTLADGEELSPRVQLTSSPYAFNSKTADTAMAVDNDVVVYDVNGKQNNVVITGGDNITVDNSGNDIVISADLSGMSDTDELVKVGADGEAGYLSSSEFTLSSKDNVSKESKTKISASKDTRGVISLKNGSISESKLNISNAPAEGNVLVYAGDPINKMIWVEPESAVDGDNLGNHTATENIQLNDKWLTNSGVDEKGLKINDNGTVTVISSDDGLRISSAGDEGIYVHSTVNNGVSVSGAGGNGFNVYQAGNDGVHINKAGSPSTTTSSSDLNNGVEIQGAEGNGVFVGQADVNGIYIGRAEGNGVFVDQADVNGMYIGRADADGIYVENAGSNGIEINSAVNSGLYVNQADYGIYVNNADEHGIMIANSNGRGIEVFQTNQDGVRIRKAGDASTTIPSNLYNGVEISGAEGNGVYVGQADECGVYVHSAVGDGVDVNTTNTNNEYGFNTNDKAYIGAGVVTAKMFSIGKNTGNQILEPGDLVVISGGYEKAVLGEDNGNPVINVKKADKAESNSIFGVVEYSMDIKTKVKKLEDGESVTTKSFRKASHDNASTGDYLSIVILGPTDVKVGDRGQDIVAGEPVKLGTNAGVRKIKSTMINGIEIFENGGIVGKALESSNGKGMVKVFVNCK